MGIASGPILCGEREWAGVVAAKGVGGERSRRSGAGGVTTRVDFEVTEQVSGAMMTYLLRGSCCMRLRCIRSEGDGGFANLCRPGALYA